MSDNDHWHYSSDIHGGAEEHHRHYDLEHEQARELESVRREIRELRQDLKDAVIRIRRLEGNTPEARQAQYEADVAMADLRASGYDEDY